MNRNANFADCAHMCQRGDQAKGPSNQIKKTEKTKLISKHCLLLGVPRGIKIATKKGGKGKTVWGGWLPKVESWGTGIPRR